MIIVHLNNEPIHFSQNKMPACPYLSISWNKNTNCLFHISIELLLMFLIQNNLSSNIERKQKLEMLKIWNQRENEK